MTHPSDFVQRLLQQLRQHPRRLALPESFDPRILKAVVELFQSQALTRVSLFGNASKILSIAQHHNISLEKYVDQIEWIESHAHAQLRLMPDFLAERLRQKGKLPVKQDIEQICRSPIDQAAYCLAIGSVDAALAGCVATTADVIRAALRFVGLSPGNQTVSGAFAMVREHPHLSAHSLLFADCGVVIEPSVSQLVDIASQSLFTYKSLFPEQEPAMAFLSFSTFGSARHEKAEMMAQAASVFKSKFPTVICDGEIQFDAAWVSEVGKAKAPGSQLPGRSNCFIFPDLNSGNICYKMCQRLAHFDAYGPILQGLGKTMNDLSRGASAHDIVVSAMIALLRANVPATLA